VNAHAIQDDNPVEQMVMVSPPVAFMDFKSIVTMNPLKLVVTGNRDDIAPADVIENMIVVWNPYARFEVIDGADHFYGGHIEQLESVLLSVLKS
jgi:alpha/beta superfamily hydrolase